MLDQVTVLLAGRAAEHLITGEISSASEHDLDRATRLARRMLGDLGMSSRIGAISIKAMMSPNADGTMAPYSDHLVAEIDAELTEIMESCDAVARKILEQHNQPFADLVEALVVDETVEADQLATLLYAVKSPPPTSS